MNIVLCTRHWDGLGLALLMQRQGSEIIVGTDYTGLEGKELKATEQIGQGLIASQPLETLLRSHRTDDTLWVFDNNDLPEIADKLRDSGQAVIGTSALAAELEDDREQATEIAQEVGLALPETEEFTDYGKALEFLEAHEDKAYVYKPDKQDPTATYVPLQSDDPQAANEELRQYLQALNGTQSPKFILQEQVQGVEANFELWLSHGQPIAAFCDLESKRKLVGDLGENIGCAGGYVFQVPIDSPLVQATVGRYLRWPTLRDYTGSMDANVIFVDGVPYFLENCCRFGYNAYPTIFQALARLPMETILQRWVEGGDLTEAFSPDIGGSLSVGVDHPKDGCPILLPPHLEDSTYLYRAYADDTGLHMVAQWPEIACVTALGSTIPEVAALCLEKAEQLGMPGKGYRTDLGEETLPTLPQARYAGLEQLGLVRHQPTEEMGVWDG